MALFLSTFLNKLDKKGRVSVPSSFRAALSSQSFNGIVVFRSPNAPAIEGFGMDRMEKLSKHIDKLDIFSDDQQDWALSIFADAQQLSFDSDGRVTLPAIFCEHAHIKDAVAFVGRGPTFQIWDPGKFHLSQEKARASLRERTHTPLGAMSNDSEEK